MNLNGWKRGGFPRPARQRLAGTRVIVALLPSSARIPDERIPDPVDQQTLASCVADAVCAAVESLRLAHGLTFEQLSRLQLYYDTRVRVEGDMPSVDNGAYVSSAITALESYGVCAEALWPYNIARFSEEPPTNARVVAADHKANLAYHCPTIVEIKASIAQGFPVAFGFTCFAGIASDDAARGGIVPLPSKNESPTGGHAVLAVGYSDKLSRLEFLNSWGLEWGDAGHGYLPYDYFTSALPGVPPLAGDAWAIRSVL